jgi:hypothetical protein
MLITGPVNLMQRVWKPGELIQRGRYNSPVAGAPINLTPPAVTGTLGVGFILTCSTGVWSGAGLTLTYQWRRDGIDIPGAASPTYTQIPADITAFMDCIVTATNIEGAADAYSNVVGPVPGVPPLVDFSEVPQQGVGPTITPIAGGWRVTWPIGTNQANTAFSWPFNFPGGLNYTLAFSLQAIGANVVAAIRASSGDLANLTANSVFWGANSPATLTLTPYTRIRSAVADTNAFVGFQAGGTMAATETFDVTNLALTQP